MSSAAWAKESAFSSAEAEPGITGRPSSAAVCLARILSPINVMCDGLGPMKMKPCSSTMVAKSALSERKP